MVKRKGSQAFVALECSVCKNKNLENFFGKFIYYTTRNKQKMKEKLTLRKYCKFCNSHTIFSERK